MSMPTGERPADGAPHIVQAGPNLPALGAQPNNVSDVRLPGYYGGNYYVSNDIITGAQPVTMTVLEAAGSESAQGVALPANFLYPGFKTQGCAGLRFRAASAAATVTVVSSIRVFAPSPAPDTPAPLLDMELLTTAGE